MSKKVKAAIKNRDINAMFNEMCGEGVVAPNIALPKYTKLKENINGIITLLENFSKGKFSKEYPDYQVPMAEILVFCQRSRAELENKLPEPPFTEIEVLMAQMDPSKNTISIESMAAFSNIYKNAKNTEFVANAIKICNKLIEYKKTLSNRDSNNKLKPDGMFIKSAPGAVFQPFPFTSFNVKEAFIRNDMTEHYRNYILMVLAMAFEYTYNIYDIYASPDWDPEIFAEIMRANLTSVKTKIPRCNKAFKKIEESLDLLKTNMNGYYREFVSTKNPSTMMENFVNDVAVNCQNTDVETSRQFKTIIAEYRKLSNNNITDPRVKSLFDQVNNIAGGSISSESRANKDDEDDDDE